MSKFLLKVLDNFGHVLDEDGKERVLYDFRDYFNDVPDENSEGLWRDAFARPPNGKDAYDVKGYTKKDCNEALDDFKTFAERVANTTNGIGVSLYNIVATTFSKSRKNLLDVAVQDQDWKVTGVVKTHLGSIQIAKKNESTLLFMNSTGQAFDSRPEVISTKGRVSILLQVQVIVYLFSLIEWKNANDDAAKVLSQTSDAAVQASMILEMFDLLHIPPYHRSLLLKSLFVDENINLFDGTYGNLAQTTRFTTLRPDAFAICPSVSLLHLNYLFLLIIN